jgi:hypothetical protein
VKRRLVGEIALPCPRLDSHGRYHTVYDGDEAVWFLNGGVIHVDYWITVDGGEPCELYGQELGMCFDSMPRRLWDRVRNEYEWSR